MPDEAEVPKPQPQSNAESVGPYRELTQYARDEITWLRSAYKFAGALVAIVFAVGVAFTYRSSTDFRNETRQETEKLTSQMMDRLTTAEAGMRAKIDTQMAELSRVVQTRVEQEFKADNVQRLVETKAKERIDAMADSIIKQEVTSRVIPLKDEIVAMINKTAEDSKQRAVLLDRRQEESEKREKELKDLVNQARETLTQVRQQAEFVQTVLAAQSDDRMAYDQLCAWAGNSSFPLQTLAAQTRNSVQKAYVGWLGEGTYQTLSWRDGFDPNGMSYQEIERTWQGLPSAFARAYLEFVWGNTNITKEQKLTFVHGVLSDSRNSLQTADKAGRLLAAEGKVTYNPPFSFGPIQKWWNERASSNSVPETATNKVPEDTARKLADPQH